ncbi:MAG: hypothetical protein Q8R35_00390 [bacterium]|nr:hypothetical protein [bacterium]
MDNLTFAGSRVFENDNIVFEVPIKRHTMDVIRTAGMVRRPHPDAFSTMYAGTGDCCHGLLYVIARHRNGDLLDHVVSVPTNVMDILPVWVDYKRAGITNNDVGVLVTGYGCAGAGVWLIDYYSIRFIELMGHDEFWRLLGDVYYGSPRPTFRVEDRRIHLDMSFIGGGRRSTVDLTPRLEKIGLGLPETLALLGSFEKAKECLGEP